MCGVHKGGSFSQCDSGSIDALAGIHLNSMAILTAHQMGSARLGVARDSSVVDTHGECWDVQNLYVADASLMPTSTGAWPSQSVSLLKRSP